MYYIKTFSYFIGTVMKHEHRDYTGQILHQPKNVYKVTAHLLQIDI